MKSLEKQGSKSSEGVHPTLVSPRCYLLKERIIKKRFLRRLNKADIKTFVLYFCLKSQRFRIYKKSVDTLLAKSSPGNILVGRGKFSSSKNDKVFGNFFSDQDYFDRVVIPMYCRQFINKNMCHIKLKAEASTERFLVGKFLEISGL